MNFCMLDDCGLEFRGSSSVGGSVTYSSRLLLKGLPDYLVGILLSQLWLYPFL